MLHKTPVTLVPWGAEVGSHPALKSEQSLLSLVVSSKTHGLILSSVNTCILPGATLYIFGGKNISIFFQGGLRCESSSFLCMFSDRIRV